MKEINLEDGKYTIIIDENDIPRECLRYGEPWRDILGDNLISNLISELKKRDEEIVLLKDQIQYSSDRIAAALA